MKRFEQILLKLIIIQFVLLLLAQIIMLYTPLAPYVGKIYEYEGVNKNQGTKTIETIDQ